MDKTNLTYKRAETPEEIRGSLALRFEVFCKELKDLPEGQCPGNLEQDAYDPHAVHFIVKDGERVVGNTRVVVENRHFGRENFGLSIDEYYDLSPLRKRFSRMAEMGRTCFLPPYRGRASLAHLWRLVYQYVVGEAGCDLGLSMGACWTDNPADISRFYEMMKKSGFVSDSDYIPGRPGLVNAGTPKRLIAPEPYQPFITAPALRMYLDVGFRLMGDPVYAEHFNEYQVLVGVAKDAVTEPYLSFFKAEPRARRRRHLADARSRSV